MSKIDQERYLSPRSVEFSIRYLLFIINAALRMYALAVFNKHKYKHKHVIIIII
jgi:hypothetical protein